MGFFPKSTRLGKIEVKIERSKRAASERASRIYQEQKRKESEWFMKPITKIEQLTLTLA